MLFAVCCAMVDVCRMPCVVAWCVARCLLFVVRCSLLFVGCWLWCVVCNVLCDVRSLISAGGCSLFVVG